MLTIPIGRECFVCTCDKCRTEAFTDEKDRQCRWRNDPTINAKRENGPVDLTDQTPGCMNDVETSSHIDKQKPKVLRRFTMADARYNVTLSPKLDADLQKLAAELGTSKAEVVRKALVLLKHAVEADEVKLVTHGEEQRVLVK